MPLEQHFLIACASGGCRQSPSSSMLLFVILFSLPPPVLSALAPHFSFSLFICSVSLLSCLSVSAASPASTQLSLRSFLLTREHLYGWLMTLVHGGAALHASLLLLDDGCASAPLSGSVFSSARRLPCEVFVTFA